MNRFLFILSIIIILVSGRLMQVYEIPGYGFIILGLGTVLVSLRRSYLGLRPWWEAGVVICSEFQPDYWYFMTLEAPGADNIQ